jgi:hypothetical protein
LKVGDLVRGSTVTHIKAERRGGRSGLRVRLKDKRAAWMLPTTRVVDVNFERPGS